MIGKIGKGLGVAGILIGVNWRLERYERRQIIKDVDRFFAYAKCNGFVKEHSQELVPKDSADPYDIERRLQVFSYIRHEASDSFFFDRISFKIIVLDFLHKTLEQLENRGKILVGKGSAEEVCEFFNSAQKAYAVMFTILGNSHSPCLSIPLEMPLEMSIAFNSEIKERFLRRVEGVVSVADRLSLLCHNILISSKNWKVVSDWETQYKNDLLKEIQDLSFAEKKVVSEDREVIRYCLSVLKEYLLWCIGNRSGGNVEKARGLFGRVMFLIVILGLEKDEEIIRLSILSRQINTCLQFWSLWKEILEVNWTLETCPLLLFRMRILFEDILQLEKLTEIPEIRLAIVDLTKKIKDSVFEKAEFTENSIAISVRKAYNEIESKSGASGTDLSPKGAAGHDASRNMERLARAFLQAIPDGDTDIKIKREKTNLSSAIESVSLNGGEKSGLESSSAQDEKVDG